MPRRKITADAIASMKMLFEQGVKVSMIAEVLGISNWTVYQVRNSDWDFDSYKDRTRMHFDKQKKSVKRDALTTDPDTKDTSTDEWGAMLESNGNLTVGHNTENALTIGAYTPGIAISDKLHEVVTQLTQLNTTFEKLLSFFETEGRTV